MALTKYKNMGKNHLNNETQVTSYCSTFKMEEYFYSD